MKAYRVTNSMIQHLTPPIIVAQSAADAVRLYEKTAREQNEKLLDAPAKLTVEIHDLYEPGAE